MTTVEPPQLLQISAHGVRRLPWLGALLGASTLMSQAAVDARFLSRVGPDQLGIAMAVSSVLLAVVLAMVGGRSDRSSRARVLCGIAAIAASALALLAIAMPALPQLAAWVGFIAAKQFAAAADLAFWMVASEHLDARQSVRALPRLSAIVGIGGALGAAIAVPLAHYAGSDALVLGAALLFAIAARVAYGMPEVRRVGTGRPGALAATVISSVRDGMTIVAGNPLARQLASLVAVSAVFGSLVYVSLSITAAGRHDSDDHLAALLSAIRSVAQVATVLVQLVAAPWLLRRLGTAGALVMTPLAALLGALLLTWSPSLFMIALVSVAVRALDQSLETPAQKLVHSLLPIGSRGRMVGVVEGLAKRSGGVLGALAGALLVHDQAGFASALLAVTAGWLWVASRMARRLPMLALASSGAGGDVATPTLSPVLGRRALDRLARELTTAAPERVARAAEVLVALAGAGHSLACCPLLTAAVAKRSAPLLRSAALAIAHTPGARLPSALAGQLGDALPHLDEVALPIALGAVAMCSVATAAARERAGDVGHAAHATHLWHLWHDDGRGSVGWAARQASRWAEDVPAAVEHAADELRFGPAESRTVVAEQVVLYAIRALAERDADLTLAVSWPLLAIARRALAGPVIAARAFSLLAEISRRSASEKSAQWSLLRAELRDLAYRVADRDGGGLAIDAAGGLRLLAAALPDDDAARGEAASVAVRGLSDRDDEVADAAAEAIRAIGVAATAELVVLAGFGRRAARDRAAALLRALPVAASALDQLIEHELEALDQTCLELGALGSENGAEIALAATASTLATSSAIDGLLVRRLDERRHEIAYTILLLVAAQRQTPAISAAAMQWRCARGRYDKARALAVLDTMLPRALAARLLELLEDRSASGRAAVVAQRRGLTLPSPSQVIAAEVAGADGLTRRVFLAALSQRGLSAHRVVISAAAHHLASAADPRRLLRRLSESTEPGDEGAEMPSQIETLLVLTNVSLFVGLATRQLDELARRTRWRAVRKGDVVAIAGQPLEVLWIVEDGELFCGARRIVSGEIVDDLAWIAPRAPAHDVVARGVGRLLAIDRAAFEELADDVPGLGASLCRVLAERLRLARGEPAALPSP
jgi:hypothetical protein